MRRNPGRIAKWTILATICLMLTFLVPTLTVVRRRLGGAVSKDGVSASEDPSLDGKYTEYRVIVDAGSSGTRAYIYGFKGKNDLTPDQEETDAFKGGLDTNVADLGELNPGDWEDGRSKLVDICKTIFKNIDRKLCKMAGRGRRFNTPVTVKFLATEGMRTYNRGNGAGDDALMRTIRSQCKLLCEKYRYTFLAAEILHGKLEAMGAWVDANCKLPNDDGTPVGIMEVGGASMQIMTRPGRDGIYCNASFGKDAAMRTIVEKLNETVAEAKEKREELNTELSILTKTSRRKQTKKAYYSRRSRSQSQLDQSKKERRIRKLTKDLEKLRADSRCSWFVVWTGKTTEHPIFEEGNEKKLDALIKTYLFTPENIEDLRQVTAKRTPLIPDSKLIRQVTTQDLRGLATMPEAKTNDEDSETRKLDYDSEEMPAVRLQNNISTASTARVNKKILARDCKRNYLLACSFEHLEDALEGTGNADDDSSYNFFEYISGIEVPKFTLAARTKHAKFLPSNRFMFFFAKQLYEELKDNIDVRDTKTPPTSIMWTRGLAIMQTFDKSNDTEMNPDELKKLIKSMRATGFCEGFFSMV